jgi:hypothetical protein
MDLSIPKNQLLIETERTLNITMMTNERKVLLNALTLIFDKLFLLLEDLYYKNLVLNIHLHVFYILLVVFFFLLFHLIICYNQNLLYEDLSLLFLILNFFCFFYFPLRVVFLVLIFFNKKL